MLCQRAVMSGGLLRMTNQGNERSLPPSLSRSRSRHRGGLSVGRRVRNARLSQQHLAQAEDQIGEKIQGAAPSGVAQLGRTYGGG